MTHLTIERTHRVEVWTLSPLPSNAADGALLLEIAGAVSDFHASPDVDVLLVWGANDAGSRDGGGPRNADDSSEAGTPDRGRMVDETVRRLRAIRKPLIAVLDRCTDANWMWLILHCDLRLAAADLACAMPQVDDGAWAPMGIARLCEVVGRERTLEWLWFRRTIEADEALRAGLVDRVVPRERLEEAAWQMATALTCEHRSGDALWEVKRVVAGRRVEYRRGVEADGGTPTRRTPGDARDSPTPVEMAFWGGGARRSGEALEKGNGAQYGPSVDRGGGANR